MKRVVTARDMQLMESASKLTAEALMERAGEQLANWIEHLQTSKKLDRTITLLAGLGNNAGDGFVALRHLSQRGFKVAAYEAISGKRGALSEKKKREFEAQNGHFVDKLPENGILLDGVFGSGFHGPLTKPLKALFDKVNRSKMYRIAIDVPSGLDCTTGEADGAIQADATLTIEVPKLGFFLLDGWNYVGELHILPIGLEKSAIQTECQLLEIVDIKLPTHPRNCNKYSRGHVVGIAGSPGMAGAAMLASVAAMRSGAGIVHLLHPKEMSYELAGPPWEIVRTPITSLAAAKEMIERASHCFVGPGLGRDNDNFLKAIFPLCRDKAILDADCLNWLSEQKKGFGSLPEAILTPHMGEMKRLLKTKKEEPLTLQFLKRCQAFTEKHKTNLLLKGAPSFLFAPNAPITIMARGNRGMATAGAGDVLTGILASLRAQGLEAKEALRTGTFLHGLAGEFAAEHEGSYCMSANSIIQCLSHAFFLVSQVAHR